MKKGLRNIWQGDTDGGQRIGRGEGVTVIGLGSAFLPLMEEHFQGGKKHVFQ